MGAALTAVTRKEITGSIGCEIVRGALNASGDYYDTKFSKIIAVFCTPNVAQACGVTTSGQRVTILTAISTVNLEIWGM